MILRDWRSAEAGLLRTCYETEHAHWRRELAWDTAWTWSTVEQGRVTWGLPGLLAFDEAERLQGWAFYVRQGATLHLGGLVAESAAATRSLLDAVIDVAVEAQVGGTACFILDRAPELAPMLAARGFDVERFHYLSRPLPFTDADGPVPRDPALRHPATDPWRNADRADVTALLQTAYPGDAGRHFAPHGLTSEWIGYVGGLVEQAGCGALDPGASRVLRDERGVQACVLATSIATATAHIAQVAVRPDCRGRGLAPHLVREAAAQAAQAGKRELTLLVGEGNAVARRIYAAMGFTPRATFIAATRARSEKASQHQTAHTPHDRATASAGSEAREPASVAP